MYMLVYNALGGGVSWDPTGGVYDTCIKLFWLYIAAGGARIAQARILPAYELGR